MTRKEGKKERRPIAMGPARATPTTPSQFACNQSIYPRSKERPILGPEGLATPALTEPVSLLGKERATIFILKHFWKSD